MSNAEFNEQSFADELSAKDEAIAELVWALERAREWIENDESPMGPTEKKLHARLLRKFDALIDRNSQVKP